MPDDQLRELLSAEGRTGDGYVWELCVLEGSDAEVCRQVAALLAARLVTYSCPASVAALWEPDRHGEPLSEQEREKLLLYLAPKLGRPDTPPAAGDDRAQSFVAEFLWYEVVRHRDVPDLHLQRIEGPSFDPTDPGGDGLVVYRSTGGTLAFRLWEIKKHTAEAALSATVKRARDQLHTRGLSYLSRYSLVGQQLASEPHLEEFYARLVDLWQEGDAAAGIGVAVATSFDKQEEDCFDCLPERFPALDAESRREGLLSALWDYERFIQLVREQVWKGL